MSQLLARTARVGAALLAATLCMSLNTGVAAAETAPPSLAGDGANQPGVVLRDQFTLVTDCTQTGAVLTYDISGRTDHFHYGTNPYVGTFTGHGTVTLASPTGPTTSASGVFGIAADDGTTITGSYSFTAPGTGDPNAWPADGPTSYRGSCSIGGDSQWELMAAYTATIVTPTGGRFHDDGLVYSARVFEPELEFWVGPTSGVTTPAPPALPTVKSQCLKDGWKTFPGFKNQGDCVSYVATRARNTGAA